MSYIHISVYSLEIALNVSVKVFFGSFLVREITNFYTLKYKLQGWICIWTQLLRKDIKEKI